MYQQQAGHSSNLLAFQHQCITFKESYYKVYIFNAERSKKSQVSIKEILQDHSKDNVQDSCQEGAQNSEKEKEVSEEKEASNEGIEYMNHEGML